MELQMFTVLERLGSLLAIVTVFGDLHSASLHTKSLFEGIGRAAYTVEIEYPLVLLRPGSDSRHAGTPLGNSTNDDSSS